MSKNSLASSVSDDFIGEKEWFFLFWVAYSKFTHKGTILTPELGSQIPLSQQTISRRIIELEKEGLLMRNSQNRRGGLEITAKGYLQLEQVYDQLQLLFQDEMIIEKFSGILRSGMGEGAHYIRQPKYLEQFYKKIGFFPYFGTLNIELTPAISNFLRNHISAFESVKIDGFTEESRTFGNVFCYKVHMWPGNLIHRQVPGALLFIKRTSHQSHIVEFICEQYLRDFFSLTDGDQINFKFIKNS